MESINPNGTKNHHASGLAEGSWKGMKKSLEQSMLCEKLWGRVTYQCDVYSKFGSSGSCFTVCMDGKPVKKIWLSIRDGKAPEGCCLLDAEVLVGRSVD